MQNNKGFTLIEILVVMVIMSITIGFAALAFGDFGSRRHVNIYAEHFVSYINLLQQRSILENVTIGLWIDKSNYTPCIYQSPTGWQPLSGPKIFSRQNLPRNIRMNTTTPTARNRESPQIILHPSGDMEPFRVEFTLVNTTHAIAVKGTHDGKLSITEAKNK